MPGPRAGRRGAKPDAGDDPAVLLEALVYRAEVALILDDPDTAGEMLTRARKLDLPADVHRRLADTLDTAATLP